ncbi:MAG: DUF1501 domain-containing protein [Methylococcales bacterium]
MNENPDLQRRRFMKGLAITAGASSLLATQGKLQLISNALAADYAGLNDYKSLVCVFQGGGNDAINMFAPYTQAAYQDYASIRQALAIPRNQLHPVSGEQHGFHPSMRDVRDLYNSGALATVADVGNLFRPTSLDDYRNRNRIPPDLFSHSHQTEIWQTNQPPNVGSSLPGWGGLVADLLDTANANTGLPPSFSMAGNNFWLSGNVTQPFDVATGGIKDFGDLEDSTYPSWASSRASAWNKILNLSQNHVLKAQTADTIRMARLRIAAIVGALDEAPEIAPFSGQGGLGHQLRMAARLISIREALGMKRQFFFVKIGGWDTHGNQLPTHADLLTQLNDALHYFYQTTQQLGVADSVTTFTASEFGRSLTSNGDGTDHAWSTQHLVMGDAVRGGQIHGEIPTMEIGGQKDAVDEGGIPGGRLIPEYSVDQYGATLAKWLDVTDADLSVIFPNLDNFSVRDLGFMS